MSVAVVVLAAGFSRRLGRPKQAVQFNGETLLQRSARIAREASVGPVFVVVNRQTDVNLGGSGLTILTNDEAGEGIASSIRAGVNAALSLPDLKGVLLMTCDQVAVTSAHLRSLCHDRTRVSGSAYAGRVGVPAYFPMKCVSDLLALRGDAGARDLLRGVRTVSAEELALDIDTEEDVARLTSIIMRDGESVS
jgi:molybdenum cofactor cytidylyltransferase/nicotine blue oxidoreductase